MGKEMVLEAAARGEVGGWSLAGSEDKSLGLFHPTLLRTDPRIAWWIVPSFGQKKKKKDNITK